MFLLALQCPNLSVILKLRELLIQVLCQIFLMKHCIGLHQLGHLNVFGYRLVGVDLNAQFVVFRIAKRVDLAFLCKS